MRGRTYHPPCCGPIINGHPDVARSALTGPPGAGRAGVVPVVVVELHPSARDRWVAIAAVLVELAARHEATAGIDRFAFIDELPVDRRHNAKIDRSALARQVAAGRIG